MSIQTIDSGGRISYTQVFSVQDRYIQNHTLPQIEFLHSLHDFVTIKVMATVTRKEIFRTRRASPRN